MANIHLIAVILFLLLFRLSVANGAENNQVQQDISQLVDAASKLNTAWPWQKPMPEIKLVARHGKGAGSLLVALLKIESFDQKEYSNLYVEQQVALALCEIYNVHPESGKTVIGIRSSDEQNRSVRQFWEKKVKQD